MFIYTQKRSSEKVVFSRYSAVVKTEDCYSEGRGFQIVSVNLRFVEIKISNQRHAAYCLRALLATLSRFMFLCVCGMKKLILYIKRVSSKMGQNFCMFKSRIEQHG